MGCEGYFTLTTYWRGLLIDTESHYHYESGQVVLFNLAFSVYCFKIAREFSRNVLSKLACCTIYKQ